MKSNLEKRASRLLFQLEEQEIQLVVIKPVPKLNLGENETLGPFKEGELVTIPAWQAFHLIKAGLAKLKNEEPINLAELYNYLWKEERQAALQPLPENFFLRIKFAIEASPEEERKKIVLALRDLLCRRIEKVVKAAIRARQNSKAAENMLPEEKMLHHEVASDIENWLSVLHRFLNIS
ncbi:MAG: hypothetical protein QXK94_06485 [Candidatus Jordarchaeales archaeon]